MLTQNFKQQLGELFLLALQANLSEEYNVWINFSGHVNEIQLRISNGEYRNIIFDDEIYFDSTDKNAVIKKLKEWKKQLMLIIAPPIQVNTKSLENASH
jgi:hypothetical protein